MRLAVRWALGLVLLFASLGHLAAAPDPSLEAQFRLWLSGLTGLPAPELPLRITPEGDHYRAALPIAGLSGPDGSGALTATLRPLDGGRWAVEDIALPPSGHFAMRVPAPDDPSRTVPAEATLSLAGQDGRMLIDPTLATPSSFEAQLRGVVLDVTGGGQHQRQQMDRYETHGTATQAAGGRLDLVQDAAIEGWRDRRPTRFGGAVRATGADAPRERPARRAEPRPAGAADPRHRGALGVLEKRRGGDPRRTA